jgi:hypothetical protein
MGTTGGAAGNAKMAFYHYDGAGWQPMVDTAGLYVLDFTYDAAGFVTGATWNATP